MSYNSIKNNVIDERILIPSADQHDNGISHSKLSSATMQWIDKHSENIIVVWDINKEIVFVSKSIKQMLGYNPSDLIGRSGTDLISLNDQVVLRNRYDNDLDHLIGQTIDLYILNKEGKYCQLNSEFEKVVQDDNVFFIGVFSDLSEERKKRDKLVESEKMAIAGQFAAGVAHEIRNPLTSIKGFLQLLQSGIEQKDAYYKIMIEEIDKLEAITSELLFISKPLTNQKKVEPVHCMINDVLVLSKSQANLKNIQWETELIDKDAKVFCDRSQIKQVLINVIKNSIEAIEQTGTIAIEVIASHSTVEIIVVDDGVGIEDDMISKVNEPFFTTKDSGTGLGLMISKQILDQHYATIHVAQNKKDGCTVRLSFPQYK